VRQLQLLSAAFPTYWLCQTVAKLVVTDVCYIMKTTSANVTIPAPASMVMSMVHAAAVFNPAATKTLALSY